MVIDERLSTRITRNVAHSTHARNMHGTRTMSTGTLNEVGGTVSERDCISVAVQQDGQMGAS